ncbi:MAG: AEC family transporter [Planctomycetes bacterium]|nr:AEC family transporter [Planctomycetota bacterium]
MNTDLLIRIALEIILPVLVMAGVGFLVGWRRMVEPEPIAKVYMTIFAPALAFCSVVNAELTAERLGQVFLFCFTSVAILYLLSQAVSRLMGHDRGMRGAFINSVVIYNSANYGLPVQELAFPQSPAGGAGIYGSAIQPIILLTQNIVGFTLGAFNAASDSPSLLSTLKRVVLMPLTWGVIIGLAVRACGLTVQDLQQHVPMIWQPLVYFRNALVPVALLSLGVQLSRVRIHGKVLNISVGVFLRLIVGPLVGLCVGLGLRALGAYLGSSLLVIENRLLAILVVSLSFPTAVFSAVLATEFRNHPDYAAATVFVSTVLSIVTVTAAIYLAHVHLL